MKKLLAIILISISLVSMSTTACLAEEEHSLCSEKFALEQLVFNFPGENFMVAWQEDGLWAIGNHGKYKLTTVEFYVNEMSFEWIDYNDLLICMDGYRAICLSD